MHVSQALWRTHLFLIALPFGSPRESWKLQLKANGYHLRSCCHGFLATKLQVPGGCNLNASES